MKGKKQPFPPRATPVSHEIPAKLRNIWKRFFWTCFNTTKRFTKCKLNLYKSDILCVWKGYKVRQMWQSVAGRLLLQSASGITKRGTYYKEKRSNSVLGAYC